MSKESYAIGFCKVAEDAGVDPVALAKFADALFKTDGKIPDCTKPKKYDTSRQANRMRALIDKGEADMIPSVTGKASNGRWGVEQSKGGIDGEISKTLRRMDLVSGGGSIDSGGMTKEEQLAWLNSHFRSLMAARNLIQRDPHARIGPAYHGAQFVNTNDVPGQVSQPIK